MIPAANIAIVLTANRNGRLRLMAIRPVELAATTERRDVAFSVVIDTPQNPIAVRIRTCNDQAVSAARIWVNANTPLKIQNFSRSKRF
jgi:hypothetical protein